MEMITIIRPDDWHLHLRDHDALSVTVQASSQHFARAIVMPNLQPPIKTVEDAKAYQLRILQNIPPAHSFKPLMALYLTQNTTVQDVVVAHESNIVKAFKLYPAGATTNSNNGVSNIVALYPVFAMIELLQLPLLIHGEVVDMSIDIFDRERCFIDSILKPLLMEFPKLKIVFEHITTTQAVEFVWHAGDNVAATITPQHLLYNRNHLLVGGIKPHFYCLPILKRNSHQMSLIKAAVSGNPKFFLGTDSAPHAAHTKENSCGCAGCFSAPYALSLYAEVFEKENALDKLEGFASFYGADFYGLPRNVEKITLKKIPFVIPTSTSYLQDSHLVNLGSGENFSWQVINEA